MGAGLWAVGAMGHEPSETTRAGHLCDLPVCFSRAGAGLGLRAKKGRSFRYMDGLESSNTSIETDCAGQGFELARVRSAGEKYVRQIGW